MKALIMLALFGVLFSGCAGIFKSSYQVMKEERAAKEEVQRKNDLIQYGEEVANAKNFMHRDHLIKMKTLKGAERTAYINQTRPTKKVLVITTDISTGNSFGEVITTYDND